VASARPVRWVSGTKGTTVLTVTLERQAVTLIRLYPRPARPYP
jgi:hypothetical protein